MQYHEVEEKSAIGRLIRVTETVSVQMNFVLSTVLFSREMA